MKPNRTWIVIADGARARILQNDGPGKGLSTVTPEDLTIPHPPTREVGTDKPGRVHDRFGPGRHSMVARVDWHNFEKERFARDLAAQLNRAANERAFDRLVLVAPPKTLGALRSTLDKKVSGMIHGELDKDLTNANDADLPSHLNQVMVV